MADRRSQLPQNIIDFIATLSDNTVPQFQRDIVCQMLERVHAATGEAVTRYNSNAKAKRIAR